MTVPFRVRHRSSRECGGGASKKRRGRGNVARDADVELAERG